MNKMDSFLITEEKKSPEVRFNKESATFQLSGNSYLENPLDFYRSLFNWLDLYKEAPLPKIKFIFKFNLVISSSYKMIFEFMVKVMGLYESGIDVQVEWHYEEDDEDLMELGETFKEKIQVPFELVEYKP